MLIEKQYIGQFEMPHSIIRYYFIQKGHFFGIEVVEELNYKLICTSEFFSEKQEAALEFVKKLFINKVTPTTLVDIIDDYSDL